MAAMGTDAQTEVLLLQLFKSLCVQLYTACTHEPGEPSNYKSNKCTKVTLMTESISSCLGDSLFP